MIRIIGSCDAANNKNCITITERKSSAPPHLLQCCKISLKIRTKIKATVSSFCWHLRHKYKQKNLNKILRFEIKNASFRIACLSRNLKTVRLRDAREVQKQIFVARLGNVIDCRCTIASAICKRVVNILQGVRYLSQF